MPKPTTQDIPLKLLDLRPDARQHSPEDITSLAADMDKNGQLQEIIVTGGKAGRYEVLSGVGRTLAARLLKWSEIRAYVRKDLSEFEKLNITFSENEERDNVSPLYQASLLKLMMDAENLSQAALAKRIRKTAAHVSQYITLTLLPAAIQKDLNRFNNLGIRHFLQISRLENESAQLRLLSTAAEEDWSVKDLTREVTRALGKPSNKKKEKGPTWRTTDKPEIGEAEGRVLLQASFDPKTKTPKRWAEELLVQVEGYLLGHTTTLTLEQAATNLYGADIAAQIKPSGWASREAVPAVDETPAEPPVVAQMTQAEAIFDLVSALYGLPSDQSQKAIALPSPLQIRIPRTEADKALFHGELRKGPGAFFAVVLGPASYYAKRFARESWNSLGIADPVVTGRRFLTTLNQIQTLGIPTQ